MVKGSLTLLQPWQGFPLDVAFEGGRRHGGLISPCIRILLIEEEDLRILGGSVRLVKKAARFRSRKGRHGLENLSNFVLLAGLDSIGRCDDISHRGVSCIHATLQIPTYHQDARTPRDSKAWISISRVSQASRGSSNW